MIEDFTIFIPTSGRTGRQTTLHSLRVSDELLSKTILVVPEDEYEEYEEEYGLEVDVLACNAKGIAATRQYIVDNCETPYLFMLDDDMVFFRREFESVKLAKATPEELEDMFSTLLFWLQYEGFPMVGVSARQGNNHVEEDYRDVTRQMNFHGISVEAFSNYMLDYSEIEVMEDFYVLLDLFTKGGKNRVMYEYCWNQRGSGADGGCSSYRDNDMQSRAANQQKEMFPEFVTVVEKESKSSLKGMENRTDVRVQWKKAYESHI